MSLLEDIHNDHKCWDHTRIAPQSYYDHQWMYVAQERVDASTMTYLTYEKQGMNKRAIKSWQKWKALYMYSEFLTEQEMRIRLVLAKRFEAINAGESNEAS